MRYYGFLFLVLACLIASVFVEGSNLFKSDFFLIAYAVMSLVLMIGSRHRETGSVDIVMGLLLLFSVGFLSTQVLVGMMTQSATGTFAFKVAIIVALDFCALGFLRMGRQMRHIEELKKNARYGIDR